MAQVCDSQWAWNQKPSINIPLQNLLRKFAAESQDVALSDRYRSRVADHGSTRTFGPGAEFMLSSCMPHRIGWWENLQETPIFDGKNHGFL